MLNLKRIIYYTRCISIYGGYVSDCLSNIPSLPKQEKQYGSVRADKKSNTRERVRAL